MISQPHESLGVELFRLWKGSWRRSDIAFFGGSMAPLTEGGKALVVSHGSQAPRIGDIVLARQRGNLVSHRIVARATGPGGSPVWITQGDASPAPDPAPLGGEDVLGIVVGVVTPQGTREIAGPCWGWARRYAAAQTRWVSRVAGAPRAPSPTARRWAMRLHRRALRGAFGAAEALEDLRAILEDWQLRAFRPPLGRLIAQCLCGQQPPGADRLESALPQAERLGMDLMLLRWMAQRGVACGMGPSLARREAVVAFRQLQWRPKLEAAVQALRRIGIEPMALKGFAQSLTLFPEDALREMRDIDLLVPADREAEARAALEALGFVSFPRRQASDFPRHHHGDPQIEPGSRLVIELHHEVVPERVLAHSLTAGFRRRAQTVIFAGGNLQVPCREDRLLHLCLHLRLHRYLGCLRDTLEMTLLIQDGAAAWDWGKMERLARESDALGTLYVGLRLSVLAFRAPVPPEFLRHLRAGVPRRAFAETRLRLLARHLIGPSPERREGWIKAARRLCKAAEPL